MVNRCEVGFSYHPETVKLMKDGHPVMLWTGSARKSWVKDAEVLGMRDVNVSSPD